MTFVKTLVAFMLLALSALAGMVQAQVVDYNQRPTKVAARLDISDYPKYHKISTAARLSRNAEEVTVSEFEKLTKGSFLGMGKKPKVTLAVGELCGRIDHPTASWMPMGFRLKYYVTRDETTYVTIIDLTKQIKPLDPQGRYHSCTVDKEKNEVVVKVFAPRGADH